MNEQILVGIQPLADGLGWFIAVELNTVIIKRSIVLKDLVAVGVKNFKLLYSLVVRGLGSQHGIVTVDGFITGFPQ
jgi:hypothetical protein